MAPVAAILDALNTYLTDRQGAPTIRQLSLSTQPRNATRQGK